MRGCLRPHQYGGGTVCQVAEGIAQRLRNALRQGSYLPSVGHELQKVTASAMEHAAWLSYDAGWPQRARRWWLETCHFADVAGVPDVRVTALTTMSLQTIRAGDGREALELVHVARKTANHDQSRNPVLLSSAEAAARTALASADVVSFPRNRTAYAAGLGAILTQRGQLDEAISVTTEAIQGAHTIRGSGVVIADLHRAVALLGQQQYSPARTFATAARRLLPTVA